MKVYVASARYMDGSKSQILFGASTTNAGACALLGAAWIDGSGGMEPTIEEFELDEGLPAELTATAVEQAPPSSPVQPCWNCGEHATGEERWADDGPHEVKCAQCGIWRRARGPQPGELPAWRHSCGELNDGQWRPGVHCCGCDAAPRPVDVKLYRLVVAL